MAPVVCHATGPVGCSIEKPLAPVLGEIAGWLRAHHDQAILLYLEDQLDNADGYVAAAAALEQTMGDLLYRAPADGGCHALPLDLTRNAMLAAGKQVLVMSDCGSGAAWRAIAFSGRDRKETSLHGFTDFPACGSDFDRATYDRTIVRYVEDSTQLSAGTALVSGAPPTESVITPRFAAMMARCGVDLLGLDQLRYDDSRLDTLVWSWAVDEPRAAGAGDCAVQTVDATRPDGRWFTRACTDRLPVACRRADGSWLVPATATKASAARVLCEHRGAKRSVPRTGYEAQRLRQAMAATGVTNAWLAYRRASPDRWVALDAR
jgi:hypothetical protein